MGQIALNYVLAHETVAIPKSHREEHLLKNLGALHWRLREEDLRRISASSLRKEEAAKVFRPTDPETLRKLGVDPVWFSTRDPY